MSQDIKLILGGIYKTILSEDPCRIIAFDDWEVFYDVYSPALNEWTLASKLKRRGSYYRQKPKVFLKEAELLKIQPLSEAEESTFRPDLPFRLCRCNQMSWTSERFEDFNSYKHFANQFNCDNSNQITLPVTTISLRPFGNPGNITALKSTLVTSIDGRGFTCIELLWLAHNLQAIHIKKEQEKGIDIFRSGHEKKVPAYYIGGYHDMAGHTKGQ